MVWLHFIFPVLHILHGPWSWTGFFPLFLGVGVNLLADQALKRAGTTVKPNEKPTTLITSGVFQITRHPMYLGFVLILLGLGVLLGSLAPLIVVPLFMVFLDLTFVRVEENNLSTIFGEKWDLYRSSVRRWL